MALAAGRVAPLKRPSYFKLHCPVADSGAHAMSVRISICPKCGAPLPPDAPSGMCPGCLLLGGFENLDAQLQRLEQFLIYADDSKQELATVNLLVQRNIPVTFGKPAAEVINETIDPTEQPRVMKALPAGPPLKFGTFSAPKSMTEKKSSSATGKTHPKASPAEVRRAMAVDQGKKK